MIEDLAIGTVDRRPDLVVRQPARQARIPRARPKIDAGGQRTARRLSRMNIDAALAAIAGIDGTGFDLGERAAGLAGLPAR